MDLGVESMGWLNMSKQRIVKDDGMKIKEIIVVEGKNDTNVLKSYFDCDTIETSGTHLNKSKLECIRIANERRGVIIFTDPDAPGERIRSLINEAVPNCKNAFIAKSKARTTKKVGVEHATKADLTQALENCMTYTSEFNETISWEEYLDLGFTGQLNSSMLRDELAEMLFLGKPNGKTLFKRLNMIQMSKEDVIRCLREIRV